MNEPVHTRRSLCERCLRPQSACICCWIAPVASDVEVLILQHPLEVANPKGSARLLHLSLPNSRLAVGEAFAEDELLAWLHAPWAGQAGAHAPAPAAPRQPLLLYPESPGTVSADGGKPAARDGAGTCAAWHEPARLRLVVLDATWRKSRKMLYLNPPLHTLRRLSLQEPPPSRYLVRKAHLPHQLSTLEAACHALAGLEGDAGKYQPLLRAFDGFIGQQLGYFSRQPQDRPS
jgi:DTW domain-containing protein YfiP